MARFLPLANTNLRDQLIIAGLMFFAIAGFLFIRYMHQAAATTDSSLPMIQTTKTHGADPVNSEASAGAEDTSAASQSGSSSSTSLTVNGRNINLPRNGAVNQTITDENGNTTTINAQHSESSSSTTSEGQASNTSSSSVDVNINSSSSSGGGE
jgi:hypothetical protein